MILADAPPAAVSATAEQSAVVVWGEASGLTELKKNVETEGAITQWRTAGAGATKTFMLWILASGPSPTSDMQRLMDEINRKKHGDLNAGWGKLGGAK